MCLYLKKIDGIFDNKEKWKEINDDAFPPVERMDLDRLLELSTKDGFELLSAYDDAVLIGFVLLGISEYCTYIFLLAVDKDQRSKGYGSMILSEIRNRYPDHQIVLDLEGIDLQADNNTQRIMRKKFYLKNGFYETGYFMDYFGIQFEVLCSDHILNESNFSCLLDRINKESFHLTIYRS